MQMNATGKDFRVFITLTEILCTLSQELHIQSALFHSEYPLGILQQKAAQIPFVYSLWPK